MDVGIMLAIAHGANLVMDGIGIILVLQMMTDEITDQSFLLRKGKLVGERKFDFTVADTVHSFIGIGSLKEGLRGVLGPGWQVMSLEDAATFGRKVLPAVDVVGMRSRKDTTLAAAQDFIGNVFGMGAGQFTNIPSQAVNAVGFSVLQADCIVMRQ